MFVYRKGRLIQTNKAIGKDTAIFKLFHPTSGMAIEIKYNTNSVDTPLDSPYIVYKEVEGQYVIYEEFFRKGKTLVKTFEEAIAFFENNIYESLNETAPSPQAPNPTPPETFQELPEVGDIIQVGSQFSLVTDVDGERVTAKKMSKDEAMKMLRNKRNADISNISKELKDMGMAKGGALDNPSESGFVEYDNTKDRIIILRSQVPKPQGGTPRPDDDGEEETPPTKQPDNIQDPFQKNEPPSPSDENREGKDGEGKDGEGKDGESEDGEGKDGKSKDGKSKDGKKGKNSEGENGDGENGDGENGEGENGESNDGDYDFGNDLDDAFGNDPDEIEDLEDLIKNLDFGSDKKTSTSDGASDTDLSEIELFLGMTKPQIKNRFKTKTLVKSALGNAKVFDTDNANRLETVLNEIFN